MTPSTSVPATATWAPCRSGTVESSSATRAWMSSISCVTLGRVGRDGLLEDELVGLCVAEVVPEEVLRQEERRQVVVRVRVVREPAELVRRVHVGRAVLGVLHPLGRLEVDGEQAVSFRAGSLTIAYSSPDEGP